MRLGQAAVTQRFGIEPTYLAAEGALYNITSFRDQIVALRLPSRQWIVLRGLILNAVLNTACFQSIAMFLTAIRFVGMNTGTGLELALSNRSSSGLLSWQLAAVVAAAITSPLSSTTVCCL